MEDLQTGRPAKADGSSLAKLAALVEAGKNTRCTSVLAITKGGFLPMRRTATGPIAPTHDSQRGDRFCMTDESIRADRSVRSDS
jgi:hypothetical protein